MGMAASQARFLGLTARKSNVEYQGQQINQQRTALATESSNLYSQMMALEVPTPPVSTDFITTEYVLDDSAIGNQSDYKIVDAVKKYNGSNTYRVKIATDVTTRTGTSNTFQFNSVQRKENPEIAGAYTYVTDVYGSYVNYDPNSRQGWKNDTTTGEPYLTHVKNRIYEVDSTCEDLLKDDETYKVCKQKLKQDGLEDAKLFFYEDASGKTFYLTEDQLIAITSGAFEPDCPYSEVDGTGKTASIKPGAVTTLYYGMNRVEEQVVEADALIDVSNSTGRYSSIQVYEQDGIPSELKGQTFSITCKKVTNEAAYEQAKLDYEYQSAQYQKAIQDINSKTEIIQAEDKKLELRLKQLDTEENAIKAEMDIVKTIIKDNVDKTFNTFG